MAPRSKTDDAAARDDARAVMLSKFITAAGRKDPGSVFTFNSQALTGIPVISTGALSLDVALGVGGLPRGRIVEVYGPESAGKTSLALSVIAQAVKGGGMGAVIDVEHAITADHIRSMGVDLDYIALSQPSSGEEAFQRLDEMLDADLFDVIVVDSVAMLVPQVELDGEMTDQQVGAQARLVSKGLRRVTGKIGNSKAVVIFINQLRMKIGQVYGNPEDTPGGKALKYNASVRLDVRAPASAQIKDPNNSKQSIGLGTRVTVKKNKVAPPQKVAEYRLIWGKGIDFAASVFDVAKDLGVLVGDGAHRYTVAATGQLLTDETGKPLTGAKKVQDALSADKVLAEQIAEQCYAVLQDRGSGVDIIPDEEFAAEAS